MHTKKRINLKTGEVEDYICKVNPEMFKLARINRDLTEEELDYFLENYKQWENQEKEVTWSDLRIISKVYGRPISYFFLTKPLKDYKSDYTLLELFEELQDELDEFKEETFKRLELCSQVELKDL